MADLNSALDNVRAAVGEFLAAADSASRVWTVPRAPGKWSPSQVVEHVARIMEESASVAAGLPSKFPTVPIFLRPITRLLVFKRILRRNSFLKMKTGEGFDPATGVATTADGHARVEAALKKFVEACRARADSGEKVASTLFGKVAVADFARFQELHVRHHREQLPDAQ
jgi:Protein of unknown function (DUF1569)